LFLSLQQILSTAKYLQYRKMTSDKLIRLDESKCKICYTCVRACPVKAIKVMVSGQQPVVDNDRCIACGTCVTACNPRAITYRTDTELVTELLANHPNVVVSLDPALASEFNDITDYRKLARMLKQLGFKQIYEVSFGVDLVARRYKSLFHHFKGRYYITSCCPAVVSYVEKFHPGLINNLAPIVSPMIAMGRVIRAKLKTDVKIVHVGPCIAAKNEAKLYEPNDSVDVVLTFEEIRKMFKERQINESTLEYSHISEPVGYTGLLYPIANGILQAAEISENLLENIVVTGRGKTAMIQYLSAFEPEIENIKTNFNLFFCKGCISGPGCTTQTNRLTRRSDVIGYANKRIKELNFDTWQENVAKYNELELSRSFEPESCRMPEPPEEKVLAVLKSIGMPTREDEVDCGACGYKTCRDFASGVIKGLTTTEMCAIFSQKNLTNYIKSLKATNEKLAQMQAAIKNSEKEARMGQEAAQEASEVTSAMLQKLRSGVVFIDKNLKVIQANNNFINMLGEEVKEISEVIPGLAGADVKRLLPYAFCNMVNYVFTTHEDVLYKDIDTSVGIINVSIFPLKKGQIVGAILRDMHQPEVLKAEIENRVSEVVEKNLEMVQKIGYLLGEGAAETERMLNSIIKSFKPKSEK